MKTPFPTKKVIIILVVVLVLWIIWKNAKGRKSYTEPSDTTSTPSVATAPTGCTNTTVLKRGSKCDRVQWAQYKINTVRDILKIERLADDGVFGAKTESAFIKLLGKNSGTWNEVKAKADQLALQSFNQ